MHTSKADPRTWLRTARHRTAAAALVLATALGAVAAGATTAYADPGPVQIDVGGSGGSGFVADAYGTNGIVDTKPASKPSLPNFSATVAHPIPAAIWNTSRFLESNYRVPGLAPGAYEVRLYFMDWYFTRPGQRVFDVAVNGTKVLTNFDIIGTAVARGADGQQAFGVEKDIPATVDASGTLSIDFIRGTADQPQVNAFVIVPTP